MDNADYSFRAAAVRHLKDSIIHLHDAVLLLQNVNVADADYLAKVMQAVRSLCKDLEASLI